MIYISDITPEGYKVVDSDSGMALEMSADEVKQLSVHGTIMGYSSDGISYKGTVIDDVFVPSFDLFDVADYKYLAVPEAKQINVIGIGYRTVNFWTVYDLTTQNKIADDAFLYEVRSHTDVTMATINYVRENPLKICSSGETLFISGGSHKKTGVANYEASLTNSGTWGVFSPACLSIQALLCNSNLVDLWATFSMFLNYCVNKGIAKDVFFGNRSDFGYRLMTTLSDSGLVICSYESFDYGEFFMSALSILRYSLGLTSDLTDYEIISSDDYLNFYMSGKKLKTNKVFYISDMGIFVVDSVETTINALYELSRYFADTILSERGQSTYKEYIAIHDTAVEEVDLDVLYPIYYTKLFFADYLKYTKRHKFVHALQTYCTAKSGGAIYQQCPSWFSYSSSEVILDFKRVVKDGLPDIELVLGDVRRFRSRSRDYSNCTFKKTYLSARVKERLKNWAPYVLDYDSRKIVSSGSLLSLLNEPEVLKATYYGVPLSDLLFTFVTRYGVIKFDVENYKKYMGYDADSNGVKVTLARASLTGQAAVMVSPAGVVTEVRLPEKSKNGVFSVIIPRDARSLNEDVLYKVLGASWKGTPQQSDNVSLRFLGDLDSIKFKNRSLAKDYSGSTVVDAYIPHFSSEKVLGDLLCLLGHSIHHMYLHPIDEDCFMDILYVALTRAIISPVADNGHVLRIKLLNDDEKLAYGSKRNVSFDYFTGHPMISDDGVPTLIVRSKIRLFDHTDMVFTESSFRTLMSRLYSFFDKNLADFEAQPKLYKSDLVSELAYTVRHSLLCQHKGYQEGYLEDLADAIELDSVATKINHNWYERYAFKGTSLSSVFVSYTFLSSIYDMAILDLGESIVKRVLEETNMFSLLKRFFEQGKRLQEFADSLDWESVCCYNSDLNVDLAASKALILNNFDDWFSKH